ncbi:hypothetical protein [Jannaschia donghaensis]|uniref:Uncharacterized protein n=1 Tax=Jannaschia donghaensis TaxID=420998 RepID=A0A0M6YK37_9RHOB|nr:hypothetical protein [Jannaschia donghaensis]CTQ50274.1 hypothetical protein JDO7802_02294 [Jannaschia donghaensis]
MLQMILRRAIFAVLGKVAGGKTSPNLRKANRIARLAKRLGR